MSAQEVVLLRQEAEKVAGESGVARGGWRGVLAKSEIFRLLANEGAPAQAAREVLGPAAVVRKATLFDKTPGANWKVPWHQDLTIAVAERQEAEGFTAWSVKEGVQHVQPPAEILEQVLAIRVHLDYAGPDNGALRVIPGSHRQGRLSDEALASLRAEIPEEICTVAAGDLHLYYPLLLHASSASQNAGHRRVLHLEYSAAKLPAGLAWFED
jgi:ectoine hydroxylase-related dioxygenase (phytanoyl-CoA dioxygenase family)